MSVPLALVVCRFVHDGAAMILWGAFGFLATLVPPGLAHTLAARLRPARGIAIALTVLTGVALLPIEAATIGERGWRDAVDPAILWAMLTGGIGGAWIGQGIAAVILIGTMTVRAARRSGVVAAGAGLMLGCQAFAGHAAMRDGALGVLHRATALVHVLAAGAWLGALVPLAMVLERQDDPTLAPQAALAMRRFSGVGHFVVALVLVSGLVNTALVVGRWPDLGSPYDRLLLLKIALVAIMTGLALLNRYGFVPRLARRPTSTLRALRRATVAEIALGAAALACVAVFGTLDPG